VELGGIGAASANGELMRFRSTTTFDNKERLVHTSIQRFAVLLVVPLLVACPGAERDVRDTVASADTTDTAGGQPAASCLPVVPEIRGSLVGQREAAQREARRVRVSGDGVARRDSAGGLVTIVPTCGSHAFRAEDLSRGQFVARLTINGQAPRFSRFENDTVYWWVYLDLTSGVPVFHSQFLSAAAQSDTGRAYLRRGDFVIRCQPEAQRPRAELAGWEPVHGPQACERTDAQMRFLQPTALDSGTQGSGGTSPWFGCTLGCCQSSRFFLDAE
jgi:hypothetical protein